MCFYHDKLYKIKKLLSLIAGRSLYIGRLMLCIIKDEMKKHVTRVMNIALEVILDDEIRKMDKDLETSKLSSLSDRIHSECGCA